MRRTAVIVAAVCVALLGLAWLVSSWLTAEAPAAVESASAPPSPSRPTRAASGELDVDEPPDEDPRRPGREAAAVARVDAGGPAPVEVAESPFLSESSAELDYAVQLVFRPDTGPDAWRNAAEVFELCLNQAPNNQRCYRGLIAAQSRLAGQDSGVTAMDLAAPIPREDAPRQMLINPSVREGVARPIERR